MKSDFNEWYKEVTYYVSEMKYCISTFDTSGLGLFIHNMKVLGERLNRLIEEREREMKNDENRMAEVRLSPMRCVSLSTKE